MKYLAFYDDNEDCQEVIEAKDETEAMVKTLKTLGIIIVKLDKE